MTFRTHWCAEFHGAKHIHPELEQLPALTVAVLFQEPKSQDDPRKKAVRMERSLRILWMFWSGWVYMKCLFCEVDQQFGWFSLEIN